MGKKQGDNNRTAIKISLIGAAATIIAAIIGAYITGILSKNDQPKTSETPVIGERHESTSKKDISVPEKQQKSMLTVQADDPIVFKTIKGDCYHKEDCGYLRGMDIPIKLSEAKALKLKPCRRCKPPE